MSWFVEGHIPSGALGLLWGKPGAGKSFVALDLALAAATGLGSWHGHHLQNGRVLYVAAEGLDGLSGRVRAWCHDNGGLSPDERLDVVPEPVNLLRQGTAEELAEAVGQRSGEDRVLTVIDTLARCMPGGDENGPKDMSAAVDNLTRIGGLLGGAVLVVHHPGRGGGNERGHSSLLGALDVSMRLTRRSGGHLELSCVKMKDAPEFASMSLRLEPTGRSCVVRTAAAPTTVCANDHELQVIDHLRSVGKPQSKNRIADAVDAKRQTTLDLVDELADDPEKPVVRVDGGQYPQYVYEQPTVPFV